MTRRLPALLLLAGLYAALLGATARPLMALIVLTGLYGCLRAISFLKERILFEPLVPADFALLGQVFRYPALYIAFVGYGLFAALCAIAIAALAGLYWVTPAMDWPWPARAGMIALLPLSLAALRHAAGFYPVAQDAAADQARYGFAGMIALYLAQPRRPLPPPEIPGAPDDRPDIVLVQAESFLDPRDFWPEPYRRIARDRLNLPAWDRMRREGTGGRLAVPARGANTMRSEFAVLSGLPEQAIGMHKFNPFLTLARMARRGQSYPALAARLRGQGYRTHAIHPYKRAFFARHAAYPAMGFGSFLDESAFPPDAPRRGPYIADEAIGEPVAAILADAGDAPQFIFAVTMENHGPWQRTRYSPEEAGAITAAFPGLPFGMAAYCYHLQGVEALLVRLMTIAERRERRCVIGLYGDHPPSFPGAGLPAPAALTSYAVWPAAGGEQNRDAAAHDLLCIVLGRPRP